MPHLFSGILVPLIGTSFGAAGVFFMKKKLNHNTEKALDGFAAGVMTAASVWSLLIPAIEQCAPMQRLSFLPAAAGLWLGVSFLILLDHLIPRLGKKIFDRRKSLSDLQNVLLLSLAVVLHNVPEGMAVGAAFAAARNPAGSASAFALSVGIAIQNFPEGAIISMPLHAQGVKKRYAFLLGVLSGAVEPAAAVVTVLFSGLIVPLLPWFLSFAAGAMLWVSVKDLLAERETKNRGLISPLAFCVGFTVMMSMDTAF